MSDLGNHLLKSGVKNPHKKPSQPVWSGPDGKGDNGGVTFSLLSRFLVCRERFRLRVIEGLATQDQFNHRLEYGNMWHVCEEAYLGCDSSKYDPLYVAGEMLKSYCANLCRKYKTAQTQIKHWYSVCKVQFPVYVKHWQTGVDFDAKKINLMQETVFDVPYTMPSGRTVRLRGKWDSVDLITPNKKSEKPQLWLQENKTKGDINEQQLQRQLTFDLQTMLYLTALSYVNDGEPNLERIYDGPSYIAGVRYNVVRRPLSGGRHNIKQHKPTKSNPQGESKQNYYNRLQGLIESEPDYFFMRWNVLITQKDIETFKVQCLNPIMEQLCDWWEWVSFIYQRGGSVWDNDVIFGARPDMENNGNHCSAIHWRHPNGVWNPLDEGGCTDVDEYLSTGSMVGLERVDNLFPELTPS